MLLIAHMITIIMLCEVVNSDDDDNDYDDGDNEKKYEECEDNGYSW